MFEDEEPKIYGLDNISTDVPVYATEGPFDSTFLQNAIAMCGADADVGDWGISSPVWVYDAEPLIERSSNASVEQLKEVIQ